MVEKPTHLYLEITSRCNLQCSHCSVRPRPGGRFAELECEDAVALLAGFRRWGGRYLTLSGGEPGLHPDLGRLITAAGGLGYELTVFTNGAAVTDEILARLRAASGRLAVSLEGPTAAVHEALRGPGTFGAAVDSLDRAAAVLGGQRIAISCTLSRPLLLCLDAMLAFARAHRAGILYLGIFEPIGPRVTHPLAPTGLELVGPVLRLLDAVGGDAELSLLFSESNDLIDAKRPFSARPRSRLIGRTVKVGADGWALPGPFFNDPALRIGRPLEVGWDAVLGSPVYAAVRERAFTRTSAVAGCRECIWGRSCAGGSLGLTWETYRTWVEPCPLCSLYQAALERAAGRILSHASAAGAGS